MYVFIIQNIKNNYVPFYLVPSEFTSSKYGVGGALAGKRDPFWSVACFLQPRSHCCNPQEWSTGNQRDEGV